MTARTRDPESKQAAILDAAVAAFTESGFRGASTATIAKAAGVSEGIVFHHFGSKHGLLEACAAEAAAEFVGQWAGHRLDRPTYRRFLLATFEWINEHPMLVQVWVDGDDRVISAVRRGCQQSIVAAETEAIAAAQRAGRCRSGDPELLARLQFGMVGEALVSRLDQPGRWDFEELVDQTAGGLVRLLDVD